MSAPFKVVQVSDTHLSRNRAYFQANWESFLRLMAEEKPDLVVHTGDLCFAANADSDDLKFGREQIERLTVPWCIVPGNHDIGEIPPDERRGHPLTPEKRQSWINLFGPDWWGKSVGGWRLIGLNAQLMGSGLEAEREQWDWLSEALGEDGEEPVLVFCHKAPFLGDPDDATIHDSAIRPDPRRRLLDMLGDARIVCYACGHNHLYQSRRYDGVDYVWAPPTSFINELPKPGSEPSARRVTGFVRHMLYDNRAEHALVEPPLFIRYDMTNWQREFGSTTKLPAFALGSR